MLDCRIDSDRDVSDQSLLNDSSELQNLEFRVVTVRVRILVDLKRVFPVSGSTPFVRDRVDVVRVELR